MNQHLIMVGLYIVFTLAFGVTILRIGFFMANPPWSDGETPKKL